MLVNILKQFNPNQKKSLDLDLFNEMHDWSEQTLAGAREYRMAFIYARDNMLTDENRLRDDLQRYTAHGAIEKALQDSRAKGIAMGAELVLDVLYKNEPAHQNS